MTHRQSNTQWSGGIAAHHVPKNSECKIVWKSSHLDFFLDQGGLFIDYLQNGQTINAEYYSFLLVQLNDILKGKTPREVHLGGVVKRGV
jgi:hypothetical protein